MAGRPKGLPKTGGRVKGSLNKDTLAKLVANEGARISDLLNFTEEQIAKLTPLDLGLHLMRAAVRTRNLPLAQAMMALGLPYTAARLANSTSEVTVKRDPKDLTDAQLAAIATGRSGTGNDPPSEDAE